jgi:hypothetical protein
MVLRKPNFRLASVVRISWSTEGYHEEKTEMVSGLSERVLQYLDGHDRVDTLHLAEIFKVDHQKVVGAVKSLQALGDVSVAGSMHRDGLNVFKLQS